MPEGTKEYAPTMHPTLGLVVRIGVVMVLFSIPLIAYL